MSKALEAIDERQRELLGDEVQIATRILEWFKLLRTIRKAAGAGVDPAALVEQIKRIDPEMLDGAFVWLDLFMIERFKAEREALDMRRTRSASASSRKCPYTADEYDQAVARYGTKQEALALALGVDRKTLRKYGRPSG